MSSHVDAALLASTRESEPARNVEFFWHDGELHALIVRNEFSTPGISFFTPPELSQQVAYMAHPAGRIIQPHKHNVVLREVHQTQEVLMIKRGRLRVDFYTKDEAFISSRELRQGDLILLCDGAHGFEVLEDLEMVEVKQGPYAGEADKTRFTPKAASGPQPA